MNISGFQPAFFQGAPSSFGLFSPSSMAVPTTSAFGASPLAQQSPGLGTSAFGASNMAGSGNVYDQMNQLMGFMGMFMMGIMGFIMQLFSMMSNTPGGMLGTTGAPGGSTGSSPGGSSAVGNNPGGNSRGNPGGNPGGNAVSSAGFNNPAAPSGPSFRSSAGNGNISSLGAAAGGNLADVASRTGGALGSSGWCLKGVATSLANYGVKIPALGSAYKAAAYFDAHPENFERINGVRPEDVKNLPPDYVVVYDRGHGSGAGYTHGHIFITAGKGRAYSDHAETISGPRPGQAFAVYKVKKETANNNAKNTQAA